MILRNIGELMIGQCQRLPTHSNFQRNMDCRQSSHLYFEVVDVKHTVWLCSINRHFLKFCCQMTHRFDAASALINNRACHGLTVVGRAEQDFI